MPGMIRSALHRSLRTGSESSGGELSPVNHLAEWRERLERSFQDEEEGKPNNDRRDQETYSTLSASLNNMNTFSK